MHALPLLSEVEPFDGLYQLGPAVAVLLAVDAWSSHEWVKCAAAEHTDSKIEGKGQSIFTATGNASRIKRP